MAGLPFFWDEHVEIEVLPVSNRIIDTHVRMEPGEQQWRATFVYGEPRVENRNLIWEKLKQLQLASTLPWPLWVISMRLLNVLVNYPKESRSKLLLVLWRAWYVRNQLVHNEPDHSIVGSVHFLESYHNLLAE